MRTIRELLDVYLQFGCGKAGRGAVTNLKVYLVPFAEAFGDRPAEGFTMAELRTWIDGNERWRTYWTRRDAERYVVRVFLWAVRRSLIARNPFKVARPEKTKAPGPGDLPPVSVPVATPQNIVEAIELYLQSNRAGTPAFAEKSRRLRSFAEVHGALTIAEARPFHLQLWMDRQTALKSAWTRKRAGAAVQACFNWLAKLGLTDRNPFRGVSFPPGERGEAMEPEEFQAMLRASKPLFRRLLIALRFTGSRPGELMKATWADLDLGRCCIELSKHKTAKKTGKLRRIMLHPVVLKLIGWIRRHDPSETHIFVNAWGRPWCGSTICQRLAVIRSKANVRPETSLYGLRHLLITQAVLAGVDIGTVAALAGHENISTTAWYMHIAGRTDHLSAAVQQVFSKRTGENGGQQA